MVFKILSAKEINIFYHKITKSLKNQRIFFPKIIFMALASFAAFSNYAQGDDAISANMKFIGGGGCYLSERKGIKDDNYILGIKKLSFHKHNKVKFKNMDKGIYSVRYQVFITRKGRVRHTKWSPRNLIEI